jgi:hypothetical protein
MQENTEKPEDSDVPGEEENPSDIEESSELSEDESPFEEHDGEVVPAGIKKQNGCGFLILILLLLTGGSGYLYYTDQIPPQIMQWIEPLTNLQPKQHNKIVRSPVVSPPEKEPVIIEEKPIFEEPQSIEEEPSAKIVSSSSLEAEHISGSPTGSISEPTEVDHPVKISGNITPSLAEPIDEVVEEEPDEAQERFVERTPVYTPPEPNPLTEFDPLEEGERNKAVQAYLDFFESSLVEIGELIKTGFVKGKDFLSQSIG